MLVGGEAGRRAEREGPIAMLGRQSGCQGRREAFQAASEQRRPQPPAASPSSNRDSMLRFLCLRRRGRGRCPAPCCAPARRTASASSAAAGEAQRHPRIYVDTRSPAPAQPLSPPPSRSRHVHVRQDRPPHHIPRRACLVHECGCYNPSAGLHSCQAAKQLTAYMSRAAAIWDAAQGCTLGGRTRRSSSNSWPAQHACELVGCKRRMQVRWRVHAQAAQNINRTAAGYHAAQQPCQGRAPPALLLQKPARLPVPLLLLALLRLLLGVLCCCRHALGLRLSLVLALLLLLLLIIIL